MPVDAAYEAVELAFLARIFKKNRETCNKDHDKDRGDHKSDA
jgi:hypothetical protein